MSRFVLLCVGLGLLFLAGCVVPNDPAVADRSERWYRRTDPVKFFAHEAARGRVYFVGVFDPALGHDSPVPGISSRDPAFRVSRTWFVATDPTLSRKQNERFDRAVRVFAERYNPLVLAYLKQHPEAK